MEFYRRVWTNYNNNNGGGSGNVGGGGNNNGNHGGRGSGAGGSSSHPDNSAAVNAQIKKLQEQNQRAKEEMDRMRSEYARAMRSHPSSYPGAG